MPVAWEVITAIIGLAAGSLLTLLAQRVRFKFELNRIYLAPFRKWCADFYGELDEFWTRYFSRKITRTHYSNVQIIDDWRALHEVVKDGPKWLAKVKKEEKEQEEQGKEEKGDQKIANKLNDLLNTIDYLWHKAEDKYNVALKDRFDIIGVESITRQSMASHLWKARDELHKEVSDKDKERILRYLWGRIP